jgi:hypothetical protein
MLSQVLADGIAGMSRLSGDRSNALAHRLHFMKSDHSPTS